MIRDQRRQLDIFIKDAIISRNIAFERVKLLKGKHVKVIQFFGTKTVYLRDTEFVSVSFIHRKNLFFSFCFF